MVPGASEPYDGDSWTYTSSIPSTRTSKRRAVDSSFSMRSRHAARSPGAALTTGVSVSTLIGGVLDPCQPGTVAATVEVGPTVLGTVAAGRVKVGTTTAALGRVWTSTESSGSAPALLSG